MMNALIELIDAGMSLDTLDIVIADLLESTSLDADDERYLVALAWGRQNDGQDRIGPEDVILDEGDEVRIGGETYRVLSEEEKDAAWEEALESYGSELVDGFDGPYFDREKWKRDARMDGVGHVLSPYDHNAHEYCVNRPNGDAWFFLFQIN